MSMSKLDRVVGAFASARTVKTYNSAKNMAASLPLDQQFKVIDHAKTARARLVSEGVL